MKRFYRIAWLTLLLGLFAACSSPPANSPVVEEVEEAAEPAVIEAEQVESEEVEVEPVEEAVSAETTDEEMAEEEMEEAAEDVSEEVAEEESASESEETMEEAESVVAAVDGPTHTPAATIEEALVERAYDQAKGADEPLMTIIEYGDFQ